MSGVRYTIVQPFTIPYLLSVIYSSCALLYMFRCRHRAEMKKRQVSKVNMSTTNATNQPKAKPRTVTWQEIAEWQFDNKYILSGYRSAKADYLEIFTSLTFLHNKSCNVYTHLIGALLLPLVATTFQRHLAEPHFLHVSFMDYAIFGIYFWCAEICLVLSAHYHLMQPHSH